MHMLRGREDPTGAQDTNPQEHLSLQRLRGANHLHHSWERVNSEYPYDSAGLGCSSKPEVDRQLSSWTERA
ncbi:hypothetical protein P7K49_031686, partial [Saguinus oedipus]